MKGIRNLRLKALKSCVCATILCAATAGNVMAEYQLVDLGPNVSPNDISSTGTVVGARNTGSYPNVAFRWTPQGGVEDLEGTAAYAVNDAGTVAGSTLTGAFVLDGTRLSTWDDQGAYGINEFGNVSGSKAGRNPYRETSIPYNPAILEGNKWTVMDIAQVYPRGTRPGVYADIYTLTDINEDGYAVGSRRRYGLAGSSAILIAPPYSAIRSAADVTYLPTPYGGTASAINDQGLIVGTTGDDSRSGNYAFAFLYDGVAVEDLGVLNGGLRSGARDINALNQVVGYSESGSGNRAFVWDSVNGMQDLNSLVTEPSWVLSIATAINNAGDIVGTGLLNGQAHGFLLSTGQPPNPTLNEPPVAIASSDVSSGKAPLIVQFSSTDSFDPDGTIVAFNWDFGDGANSMDENPSHTYTSKGNYIAMLTVTDDKGVTDRATVEITVKKSPGKH